MNKKSTEQCDSFYQNKINVDTTYYINTDFLFLEMMKENYFSYDVFFRMAVIDEYLNNNCEIWDLYYKLR